jgi:hypothetical protein
MSRIVQNDYVNSALTVLLMGLVVALIALGTRAAFKGWRDSHVSTQESPYVAA